jgi:hypothetical protein
MASETNDSSAKDYKFIKGFKVVVQECERELNATIEYHQAQLYVSEKRLYQSSMKRTNSHKDITRDRIP